MEKSEPINPEARTSGEVVGHNLKHKLDNNVHDQGAALFQEVQEYSPEELEAESAKVRSLIDWHIMPIVYFYQLYKLIPN